MAAPKTELFKGRMKEVLCAIEEESGPSEVRGAWTNFNPDLWVRLSDEVWVEQLDSGKRRWTSPLLPGRVWVSGAEAMKDVDKIVPLTLAPD